MGPENLLLLMILTTSDINYSDRRQSDHISLFSLSNVPGGIIRLSNGNPQSVIVNNNITNINIFGQKPSQILDDPTKNERRNLINKLINMTRTKCASSSIRASDVEALNNSGDTKLESGLLDSKRLIGGKQANINSFPFQVQVEIDGKLACAGVIVSGRIVLSVAHCFKNDILKESTVFVRAGTSKRGGIDGVLMEVEKVENHEKFGHNLNPFDYDISILWLKKPLKFSKSLHSIPIAKPVTDKIIDLFTFYVPGWGVEKESSRNFSDNLKFIEIHMVNWTECNAIYEGVLTERMLCAGNFKVDACQGDSGGGLVHDNTLYGIVSWGIGCGRGPFPGLYTDVTKFRDWIQKKTGILCGGVIAP